MKLLQLETAKKILLNHGISPSFQRMKIYTYLLDTKSHPTVHKIYDMLKDEIPSLSKTTVYNVLNLLVNKGLVNQVRIEDNELRFDAEIKEHGHFKCVVCGRVTDEFFDHNMIQLIKGKRKINQIELM